MVEYCADLRGRMFTMIFPKGESHESGPIWGFCCDKKQSNFRAGNQADSFIRAKDFLGVKEEGKKEKRSGSKRES